MSAAYSLITWRKSSQSQSGDSCVELAHTNDMIRDSKNRQVLPLTRDAVAALVCAVQTDRL